MRQTVPIVPPRHGLNDAFANADQPFETTTVSKNMRTVEADTGKLRVSQRAGYTKFNSNSIDRNFISWSEDFSKNDRNGTPGTEGWKIPAVLEMRKDGTLAPDGQTEAYLLTQTVAATGTDVAYIEQEISVKDLDEGPAQDQRTGGGSSGLLRETVLGEFVDHTVIFSVFLKWDGRIQGTQQTVVRIRQSVAGKTESTGPPATYTFRGDWDASGVLTDSGVGGSTAILVDELTDGWYRVSVSMAWDSATESTSDRLSVMVEPYSNNATNTAPAGCYMWGAQLEVASVPTNYQPRGALFLEEPRKTQSLIALNHTNQWLDYSEETGVVREGVRTPKKRDATRGVTDTVGNLYLIDGKTSVVKMNSKHEVVFSIDVPVTDKAHILRALHVDPAGGIFVGVSGGGKSQTASVFHYRQGPDVGNDGELIEESYHLVWQYDVGGYVVDLDVYEHELFIGLNRPQTGEALVLVLRAIDGDPPLYSRQFDVAHPLSGMDITSDGSLLVTSPSADPRGINPQDLYVRSRAVSWTPPDYENYAREVWCWLDASEINGPGHRSVEDLADGDKVTRWVDLTGQGRDLSVPIDTTSGATTVVAPRFRAQGIGVMPTVSFNGTDQGLVSEPNPSTDASSASDHRTVWPSFKNATATMFIVLRVGYTNEGTVTSTPDVHGAVIGQQIADKSSGTDRYRVICSNRKNSTSISPAYTSETPDGVMSVWDLNTDHPTEYDMIKTGSGYGLRANVVVITYATSNAGTNTLRFNGTETDTSTESKTIEGVGYTSVGFFNEDSSFNFYTGDIAEIITYQEVLDLEAMELHEGYLMNKYGAQHLLDITEPHPYRAGYTADPPTAAPVAPGKVNPNPLYSQGPVAAKFDPSGELAWVLSNYYGTGYDIVSDGEDGVYTIGEVSGSTVSKPSSAKGQGYVRRLEDKGDSVDAEKLVAASQHNMITGAFDFSTGGSWSTHSNITYGADAATGPDLTMTADSLTDSSAGATGYIEISFADATLIDGEIYTFSVYLKTDDSTESGIVIQHTSGTKLTRLEYTWASGLIETDQTVGDDESYGVCSVTADEDDWYRFAVSMRYDATDATTIRCRVIPDTSGVSGQGAVWAWGAQIERGKKATKLTDGENADFRVLRNSDDGNNLVRETPKLSVDTFGNLYVPAIQREGTGTGAGDVVHFGCRIYDKSLRLLRHIDFGENAQSTYQGCYQVLPNLFPPDYTPQSPGVTYNRCLFTEELSSSTGFWSEGGSVSVSNDAVPAPDGKVTADEITSSSIADTVFGSFSDLVDGEDYTFSVYLKRGTATAPIIRIGDASATSTTTLAVDYSVDPPKFARTDVGAGMHKHTVEKSLNDFYRLSVTFTYASSEGAGLVVISAVSGTVYAWGAQLEHGDKPRLYQLVRGTTPFPPAADKDDTIDLADKATFLCTRDPLPTTLFGEGAPASDIWSTSGTISVDDTITAVNDPVSDLNASLVVDGATSGILYRTILPTDLDADGKAVLVDGEVYKFSCWFSQFSAIDPTLKLLHSTGTTYTELVLTWATAGPTPDIFTEGSAGDGVHVTAHEMKSNVVGGDVQDKWVRMEVQVTYDKDDGDGSLLCQIIPGDAASVYIWGATFAKADGLTTVKRQTLVRETPNGLSPRSAKLIAINSGSFHVIGRDMIPETPHGGGGALGQCARYVSSTAFLQKVFATDGQRHVVLDPTKDGRVVPLVAEKGEIPERTQLVANWRNRLVLARSSDDPHLWFMSAIGDPLDWDYFTPPLTSAKAAFFGSTRAGRSPDIINSVCSYDDRNLIIGCDAAIWYMQDDPLAGGTWQQITDITGMHYGNHAWCKDPKGFLYFFGSRGGFYVMAPGGKPERMTENTIERRLSDIDLDSYYIECFWNYRAEGIEIFQIPFKGGGTTVKHYFWGKRYDEWREDEFNDTDQQPTSAFVIDGEKSNDRRLLIATEDGHILEWDEDSKNDDGTLIDSKELIGPLSAEPGYEARWSQLEMILSTASDGATFNLYRGEDAETLGSAIATGTLTGGRNSRKFARMRGANLWLELTNGTISETWAFEKGNIKVARAGRTRNRTY